MTYLTKLLLVGVLTIAFAVSASAHTSALTRTDQGCLTKACLKRTCDSQKCKTRVDLKRWKHLQRNLPQEVKAMLARLRGCETRGIKFPHNYRWKGHHRGAYQYDFATWREAGGQGDPADASPPEQDVRTARFYPSHRGRWECKT